MDKKRALPLSEWNEATKGISEDARGEEFPPILCMAEHSEGVIEQIEEILGDFMWDVWDEAEVLQPLMDQDRIGWAEIQFEGPRCRCCGNFGGTIRYFDRNRNQICETEFSD